MRIISRVEAKSLGLKLFFTGVACVHGHVTERRVSGGACVVCAKARSKTHREQNDDYYRAYRVKNREKARAHCKAYYAVRADDMRAYAKRYRKENADLVRVRDDARRAKEREVRRERERQRYLREGERIRSREADRYLRESDYIKERVSKYRERHPDKVREQRRPGVSAARARKKAAPGKFTKDDVRQILEKQHFICAACSTDVSSDFHVDHITPLSRGGTNWPENIQILCQPCNLSKGKKTMDEWLAWKVKKVA